MPPAVSLPEPPSLPSSPPPLSEILATFVAAPVGLHELVSAVAELAEHIRLVIARACGIREPEPVHVAPVPAGSPTDQHGPGQCHPGPPNQNHSETSTGPDSATRAYPDQKHLETGTSSDGEPSPDAIRIRLLRLRQILCNIRCELEVHDSW